MIRKAGRFKWFALAAMPIMFLGVGLMIYFRYPTRGIGYVVMCEIFKAFAGGTLVVCSEMAAMASGKHENIAVAYALVGLFSRIGGSIGSSVSGAIWSNTLPGELRKNLPEGSKDKAAAIYGSLAVALSYPVGSPVREAIVESYAVAQRRMLITGVAILPLAVVAILMWRDIRLKETKQLKGTVF